MSRRRSHPPAFAAGTGRRLRRRRATAALAVAALAMLAGCAGDSAGDPPSTTAARDGTVTIVAAPATSEAATVEPGSTVTSPPQPIDPAATTVTAAPSPTGVPGIDATDEFCAAWARYGGTVQIVAVAVNFGGYDASASAELELQSAPTVVEAVAQIEANWPSEIAAERDVAVDRYLGPYERRAAKAVEALRGAGVDDAGQGELRAAWSALLTMHDPDEPTVAVDLPADLAAQVAAGAAAFDAAVTPWGADPSLTADLDDIPRTKAYLAAHCTDLASIGIGDDI